MRMQDEQVHIRGIRKRRSRRAACIARGRARHRHALSALTQNMIENLRDDLHRDVLERERRTVMEFHHETVRSHLDQWCNRPVRKACIGAFAKGPQDALAQAVACECRQDPDSHIDIALVRTRWRDGGPLDRNIKAAIRRQSGQTSLDEINVRRLPPRGNIPHYLLRNFSRPRE